MSILNTTILELSSQGFFVTVFKKPFTDRNGVEVPNLPFLPADKTKNPYNLPTLGDSKRRVLSNQEWETVFKHPYADQIDRIAVVAGGNGVLAFDFDIKAFNHKDDDTTDQRLQKNDDKREALNIWKRFKFELDVEKIPYYLEESKSGGEHIIVLCKEDVENIQPDRDICPLFDRPFIECFASKKGYTLPQSITIAPSVGYTQLSEISLLDLAKMGDYGRITAEQRASIMGFFNRYQKDVEPIQQVDNSIPSKKNEKEPTEKYVHKLTLPEIYDIIRINNNLISELESLGFTRRGNRMSRPGKSETDIEIIDNGKKIFCYAASDRLHNNGNPCDILDIYRIYHGDQRVRDEIKETVKRYAPSQATPKLLKAETATDIIQEIQETSRERVILNIYKSKSENDKKVLEVRTMDGVKFFTTSAFSNRNIDETGMNYFSSKYMNSHGSFSILKKIIKNEMESINPKLYFEHPDWYNEYFHYNSNGEYYVEYGLFDEPTSSFDEWKTNVFDVASKYRATSLGILMAFAAPFVSILHQSFGINLVGDSNIGKTMTLRIAKGMYTNMKILDDWDFSYAAMERKKFSLANGIMCLDEMTEAGEIGLSSIMKLCGVSGRARCEVNKGKISVADSLVVPTLILSSSEISFQERAKRFKIEATKGMFNRFMDFEVEVDDFPTRDEFYSLFDRVQKTQGAPIARLCEVLSHIKESELREKFSKYKKSKEEDLKKMPISIQRVFDHLLFLEFVSKFILEHLGIDGELLYKNAASLFERFLDISKDILNSRDVINIIAIKEKIYSMMQSLKYSCPNKENFRPSDEVCFYVETEKNYTTEKNSDTETLYNPSDIENVYCFKDKLTDILIKELNISKQKCFELLKELEIFSDDRVNRKIYPLDRYFKVYEMKNLDSLDPDKTKTTERR